MAIERRTSALDALEAAFGRLLLWLALFACALLLLMMLVICADVLLRNVPIGGWRGLPGANDLSEYTLYLVTMLAAPWLLRQGQHIRVDILLRVLPRRFAWVFEWIFDVLALACCLAVAWYAWKATAASRAAGSITIKTLVTPEWWSLIPLPITFVLLAIEVLFRMKHLAEGPRGPREDAVSAA